MSNSEEEEIARDYICFGNPDVTVIVVDSTCLERNLNLVFQIMEITDNIIVCVNLLDEAKKKKIKINLKKLEQLLGVPVVGTTARDKRTLEKLKDTIYKVCTGEIIPCPNEVEYNSKIEENINLLEEKISDVYEQNTQTEYRSVSTVIENKKISRKLYKWISVKLIDGEEKILNSIKNHLNIDFENENIQSCLSDVKQQLAEDDITTNNFKDKIKILKNAKNVGAGASRNKGLKIASGEYITFIDSDDYIEKNTLKRMYESCVNTDSDIARINMKKVFSGKDVSFLVRRSNVDEHKIIIPKEMKSKK